MMKIEIEPGVYVVAVSGGVDSMALLNMLSVLPDLKLIVAHFDHGIREDSSLDADLVRTVAEKYDLPFVLDEGQLGSTASEATAREARYAFLEKVASTVKANAVITAHHQDDVLETAIINMLRGTNRKGLSSLKSSTKIIRPLLKFNKIEIIQYAKDNKLEWREDSTNQDTNYMRNYVRQEILPKFSEAQKGQLLSHIDKLGELNQEIDELIDAMISQQKTIDREWFISLDYKVALDVMAGWLRARNVKDFDKKRLELLVRAAKTFKTNKQIDINKVHKLTVKKDELALVP